MIFPQVVRKRNRGRTGERQKEGYTKVKSSERTVCQRVSVCMWMFVKVYGLASQ